VDCLCVGSILFEELFREFNEAITYDNLGLYLSMICDVHDERVLNSISNHFFLVKKDLDRFAPRHEVLKVYFVARFLAKSLIEVTTIKSDRKKVAEILAKHSLGNTQIVDWLVSQLGNLPKDKLIMAIKHASEIVNEPDNIAFSKPAGCALFNVVLKMIRVIDKVQRLNLLAEYFGATLVDSKIVFNRLSMTGSVLSFDFSNCIFSSCNITDVDFKNCIFNNATIFKECTFGGVLKFTSCKGEELLNTESCVFSKEAELLFYNLFHRKSRTEIMREFAEDALMKAVKKFRRQFGYKPVDHSDRLKGMPLHNPYNNAIWNVLENNGVIKKNKSAGTSEAWYSLSENHDIRRELVTFLDNGYLGLTLKKVLNQLLELG
jgi:hypothetical protein